METFNLIAIDPGGNTGISVYTINAKDLSIVSISTSTLILNNMITESETVDTLLLRLEYLNSYITGLMKTYNPIVVAMEAAFANSKFPKSVMQLSQYIATIQLAIRNVNPFTKIFNYPPKLVKKLIGATGNADKDSMANNIYGVYEISNLINPNLLSEHEIDSLSIGYICLEEIRNNPFLLYVI